MLFHCCSLPSPRALVQESSDVEDTMHVSVISHFWVVHIFYIGILNINFVSNIFLIVKYVINAVVTGFNFAMYATCW